MNISLDKRDDGKLLWSARKKFGCDSHAETVRAALRLALETDAGAVETADRDPESEECRRQREMTDAVKLEVAEAEHQIEKQKLEDLEHQRAILTFRQLTRGYKPCSDVVE